MSAPVDLVARREARARDVDSIAADIANGFKSGTETALLLEVQPITEVRIVSLERHLVALGVLVANLRRHVPARGAK